MDKDEFENVSIGFLNSIKEQQKEIEELNEVTADVIHKLTNGYIENKVLYKIKHDSENISSLCPKCRAGHLLVTKDSIEAVYKDSNNYEVRSITYICANEVCTYNIITSNTRIIGDHE